MEDFSEAAIRNNCPHCDTTSYTFKYTLDETEYFYIICDPYPIEEGHILVIPKVHVACIGEYDNAQMADFKKLYKQVNNFVRGHFGSVAVFEHGRFGQTVFHSHIHFLPFEGTAADIVPEGETHCRPLNRLEDLRTVDDRDGGYLFLAIGNDMWTVDPELAVPRFFRDRFANALGAPERGNWKTAHHNPHLMHDMSQENRATQKLWRTT